MDDIRHTASLLQDFVLGNVAPEDAAAYLAALMGAQNGWLVVSGLPVTRPSIVSGWFFERSSFDI